jgi:NADH-quinone oxidoreductase subunit E
MEPVGRHRFYMCTNLSCTLRGAQELTAHLLRRIGASELGEVSADGLFSVESVECLGACEYAPMARVDHRYHYDLTEARLDEMVEERRRAAGAPERRDTSEPAEPTGPMPRPVPTEASEFGGGRHG